MSTQTMNPIDEAFITGVTIPGMGHGSTPRPVDRSWFEERPAQTAGHRRPVTPEAQRASGSARAQPISRVSVVFCLLLGLAFGLLVGARYFPDLQRLAVNREAMAQQQYLLDDGRGARVEPALDLSKPARRRPALAR